MNARRDWELTSHLRLLGDNLHCSPLDRAYKSKPLAHYPENVPWNPFDAHGICMVIIKTV